MPQQSSPAPARGASSGVGPITGVAAGDVLTGQDGMGVAALIRAGDITPLEAVEAAIARAKALQPLLNFVATPCYDRARAAATLPVSGPFGGVPTLMKDASALEGVRMMFGSRSMAQHIASSNSPFVAAMLAAGAIPIGKSTTPEFGITCTTEPLVTGITRNPWNLNHSTSGSSGGAAAAVAAGVVPFAQASDGGGSTRTPAANCGLVGLKPSLGRLIHDFPVTYGIDLGVSGVLTRTVRDTAAWLAATERTGPEAVSVPIGMVTGPSARRLRVGLCVPDLQGVLPHPDVAAAVEAAARLCEAMGHHVTEVKVPVPGSAFREAFTLYWAASVAAATHRVRLSAGGVPLDEILEPLTLQLADLWRRQPAGTLRRIVATLQQVQPQYESTFHAIDVLITPALSQPPLAIGDIAPTLPFDVGFARVMQYSNYTPLQSAAGAPAVSLPLGMSAAGLPIGVQFSAAIGDERTLLELAYELEDAAPWRDRHPALFAG